MADHRLEIILAARDATKNAFLSVTGHVTSLTKNIFSLRGAFATLAGTGGIGLFVEKSLEMADTIGKTADKLGVSTDALQEYRYAASLAGVEQNTLDMALQRFTRRTAEAAQGKGELKAVLEQYNIAVKDATGRTRNHEEVLNDLADVIAGTESESERLRIAFKAFDSEGAALVNLLKNGSAAMNKVRQDARDLGIVMNEDLVRNSEKATDELEKLTRVLKVNFMSAAAGLAPEIAEVAKSTTDWWIVNQQVIKQDVAGWVSGVTEAVKIGIKPLQAWADLWKTLGWMSGGGKGIMPGFEDTIAEQIQALEEKRADIVKNYTGSYKDEYIANVGASMAALKEKAKELEKIKQETGGGSAPPPHVYTGLSDAAKKQHEALMKEVEKYQEEFQQAMIIPSGTYEIMEQQLRRGVGESLIPYDATKEDVEKSREAFESMYSDLKFQSADYYDYRRAQLEKQAEDYEKYTGNTVLAHQWLTEQIKALDADRLAAAKKNNVWLVELSERTAEAIEDNFSQFFRDAFRGELDSAADYFRAFCHSLSDSFSDMLGQMTKEILFGGGTSGGSGLFGSMFSGIGSWFSGGTALDASAGLGADWSATLWHKGGTIGKDTGGQARSLPASVFSHAPRLHKGYPGLAADEFPAILKYDETVLPPGMKPVTNIKHEKNITISTPVNIEGHSEKRLAARMREEMEKTALRVLREEMR